MYHRQKQSVREISRRAKPEEQIPIAILRGGRIVELGGAQVRAIRSH